MTTLAARSGWLAADTQVSCGSRKNLLPRTKVKFYPEVGLIGFAGQVLDIIMVEELILEAKTTDIILPKGSSEANMSALLVDLKGDIYSLWIGRDEKLRKLPEGLYCAKGSGEDFAFGALAKGATAFEAVTVACQFDVYSSGYVDNLCIKDFV